MRNIFVVFDLPAGWASLPGHSEQLGGVDNLLCVRILLHLDNVTSQLRRVSQSFTMSFSLYTKMFMLIMVF